MTLLDGCNLKLLIEFNQPAKPIKRLLNFWKIYFFNLWSISVFHLFSLQARHFIIFPQNLNLFKTVNTWNINLNFLTKWWNFVKTSAVEVLGLSSIENKFQIVFYLSASDGKGWENWVRPIQSVLEILKIWLLFDHGQKWIFLKTIVLKIVPYGWIAASSHLFKNILQINFKIPGDSHFNTFFWDFYFIKFLLNFE